MPTPTPNSVSLTLPVIELGLTLIILALAICMPETGSTIFGWVERIFAPLARRRGLSIFVAGASACLIRLLLLPISPIPQPWIQDDFSFLLAADTFAHGRLTNPTPALWQHFESFHIDMQPTYMSMYFPAQGLVMAAGQVIAGHPWWGVWASCGLMCAALCWMLQAWVPPGWALLGAMLAVLRLATFSYWINTYTGGAVPAIGGALVLGALPRILRRFRTRDFFWMGLGLAILANSRPYEGLLVSAPAMVFLLWHLWKRAHPPITLLLRRMIPAAVLLIATLGVMGYYNWRVFGNPFTIPYKINRDTYASAQHFIWQRPHAEPAYRHLAMRNFYTGSELKIFREETGSIGGFLSGTVQKSLEAVSFYLSFTLIPLILMLPSAFRDRRLRLLTVISIVLAIGLGIETFFIPHYLAPATALLLALLLQSMRHLRVKGPSGLFLVRAIPAACVLLAVARIFAQPLHIELPPALKQTGTWAGGTPTAGFERARVAAELESHRGAQLAIVRYVNAHLYPEWVYNAADIDKSKVVWAREMDPESNRKLLNYYKNRTAWLVEPDSSPPRVVPYNEVSCTNNYLENSADFSAKSSEAASR